jgi:hypothetical protein
MLLGPPKLPLLEVLEDLGATATQPGGCVLYGNRVRNRVGELATDILDGGTKVADFLAQFLTEVSELQQELDLLALIQKQDFTDTPPARQRLLSKKC